jgi:predicted AlkP superfamily pyrophosphatase or phosphodiesterase
MWGGVGAAEEAAPPPRLVLQITVDQLRGDLPRRVFDRLGQGGFRYLWNEGTVFEDAHHEHANTETIVGHATLATGAYPSAHGMVGNVWLDRESGELTYNIEDDRYGILTVGADVDDSTEIDPTQRVANTDGRSPAAILVTTFSDEMALFFGENAKIFGVSVKDRGAVSLAGHAGKAFWFSKATGDFVTSNYYYDQYPRWVEAWNRERHLDRWDGKSWGLSGDPSTYRFGDRDDRPYETDLAGFGRTFPHPYGSKDGKYYSTLLTVSPAGDELTLDFAKALIDNEGLGQDETPDYLAVSFSSTDYVGHMFGPSSLESEDNLMRLDRTLAELLRFVDEKIGLERTLIVLSADHGGAEAPGYLNELGISARIVDPKGFDRHGAIEALKKRFGIGEELIQTYFHPYLYLNREAIAANGLDQGEVEEAVANELIRFESVALAVSSSALAQGNLPDTPLIERVLKNFNPRRSGDIYVVFEPHSFVADMDGLTVATTHGSPWGYDTYVPIVFAGAGVPAKRVQRTVSTIDVARTLAALLGTKPPSGAVGEVLVEVIDEAE